MSPQRIAICDDEPDLRSMVAEYLSGRGFDAVECEDGQALLAAIGEGGVDLAILDVSMPGMDGISVLREMRQKYEVPVVMLTAAVETIDRVLGLEMGADDYIGKPVDLRELEARVKSVLRRSAAPAPRVVSGDGRVGFGACTLDLDNARLFGPDDEEIPITAMEYQLMKVFVANRGRVLNRDQLLEQAHDRGWEPFDRSIDLRISRLRRKIEANPAKPETIRTVRGIGYIFD